MASKNDNDNRSGDNGSNDGGDVPARREHAPAQRAERGDAVTPARAVAENMRATRATIAKILGENPEALGTFERVCMRHYAQQTNPDFVGEWAAAQMQKVDPMSYVLACIDAATDGLLPDGKHGVIIPRGKVAVWTPMWRGLAVLARRGNPGIHFEAHVVYQIEIDKGLFVMDYVTGITRHVPWQLAALSPAEREHAGDDINIACAYAIARDDNGRVVDWRPLWRDNLQKRAEMSGNPKNTTPGGAWPRWFPEMCQAKAIRALCDWMEIGTAYLDAVERHDDRERTAVRQLDTDVPAIAPTPSNGASRNALADEIRGAGAALPEGGR